MSLHTCIFGNEELKTLEYKDKEKLYQILLNSGTYIDKKITKTNLKKILRLFYILDCINKKLSTENKIVLKDIENDKKGRELIKEYIDTSRKLYELQQELKKIRFDGAYNPLKYSTHYEDYSTDKEYYNKNNLINEIMGNNGKKCYHLGIYLGDIINTKNAKTVEYIMKNNESEG